MLIDYRHQRHRWKRPSVTAAPAGCPAMTTRATRAPATAQPHGRVEAGAHSAAQDRSRLAQVSENEGCGTLVTLAMVRVGVSALNKDGIVGDAMAGGSAPGPAAPAAGLVQGCPAAPPSGSVQQSHCRNGRAGAPSARDGALRCAALPGRTPQHHSVVGAGLRVSFPKPPVPVVRWNLAGPAQTCMAIPSSGVVARTRG